MPENYASGAVGATASGDGVNLARLIDDTEATNWASLDSPIAGKQVTVRLDPSRPAVTFRRVQVSALLRQAQSPNPGPDTAGRTGSARSGSSRSSPARHGAASTAARIRSSRPCSRARRRVPGSGSAPARARADHAVVRRAPDTGDASALRVAEQPVHGRTRVSGRAGRRSALPDGLQRGKQRGAATCARRSCRCSPDDRSRGPRARMVVDRGCRAVPARSAQWRSHGPIQRAPIRRRGTRPGGCVGRGIGHQVMMRMIATITP